MIKKDLIVCSENLIDSVLTAATNVHKELGPGLFESVYESAMMIELAEMGINAQNQAEISAFYKGQNLGIGFRADIIVEKSLLLELKSVDILTDVHLAQVITYLKLLKYKRGFLLNFNCTLMKDGIKRISI